MAGKGSGNMLYNFDGEYCYEDASMRLKLFHRIVSYLTDINMDFMTSFTTLV